MEDPDVTQMKQDFPIHPKRVLWCPEPECANGLVLSPADNQLETCHECRGGSGLELTSPVVIEAWRWARFLGAIATLLTLSSGQTRNPRSEAVERVAEGLVASLFGFPD